jgi:transposase InsO family protein
MKVTRSGYYHYLKHKNDNLEAENELRWLVKNLFTKSRNTYGIRRIKKSLEKQHGIKVNRDKVAKIMREEGLIPKTIKKYKATTNSKHKLPVHPNLIKELTIDNPNQVWVSDITYVRTEEGWLYLAAVMDLYTKEIVGYAMSERINKELVQVALQMAKWKQHPDDGVILHSDRGVQYASRAYQELLSKYKMVCSMSAKGNPYENAAAESFNATIKKDLIYPHGTYQTRMEARSEIFEYIEVFYNRERLHSSIYYETPYEFRLEQLKLKQVVT